MIDLSTSLDFDGLPGIVAYPDDRMPGAFYVLPRSPRLVRSEDRKAQLNLVLYGTRLEEIFEPTGGLVSCTTALALTVEEESRLREALERFLAESAEAGGNVAPSLRLLSPEWREGRVELRLTSEIRLTGQPSMFGANQCAISHSLDADRARDLEKAWRGGLKDALIVYDLEISARASAASTRRYEKKYREGTAGAAYEMQFSASIEQTDATPTVVSLTVSGPIGLTTTELVDSIREVDFGS